MADLSREFAHDPASARQARMWVSEALIQAGLDQLVESAELLVSELITNVVLHARSEARVDITIAGETVTLAVHDASAAMPIRKQYGDDATTGRGLRFLETFASAWGASPDGSGKRVWFLLDAAAVTGEPDAERSAEGADAEVVELGALAASFGEDLPEAGASQLRWYA